MTRERRKYRRIEAKVAVRFGSREELVGEYTKNISKGGIFLRTDRLLDPNAEVELTMTFPEGGGEHHVRGRVVRLMTLSDPAHPGNQVYGAGIRFVSPDPEMTRAIEIIVVGGDPSLKKS